MSALNKSDVIYVAGHLGMVGRAIIRHLEKAGFHNILVKTHAELDLCNQQAVNQFFEKFKIDYVVLAAARVGGIYANNQYPAEFIYQNLMIETNVIHAAWRSGVERLLFLGSSCIYPKYVDQPIQENALLTGKLETTNEPYAVAKIAGIKLCEAYNRQYGVDYRSVMPTNLYGSYDNFHLENAHVIPAMLRRFHEAKINRKKQVVVWGTGKPLREFMYVDDMASACVHIMNTSQVDLDKCSGGKTGHINIGTGEEYSIEDLAYCVKGVVVFEGDIIFDENKPDGTPRKLLDIRYLQQLGWKPRTKLEEGLQATYRWFLGHQQDYRT